VILKHKRTDGEYEVCITLLNETCLRLKSLEIASKTVRDVKNTLFSNSGKQILYDDCLDLLGNYSSKELCNLSDLLERLEINYIKSIKKEHQQPILTDEPVSVLVKN